MELEGELEFASHLQVLEEKIYPRRRQSYVDAFWKWWPSCVNIPKLFLLLEVNLLLQQNAWKFLDKLDQTGECKDMIVQINSNHSNIKTKLNSNACVVK